jgi:hypothetical protein
MRSPYQYRIERHIVYYVYFFVKMRVTARIYFKGVALVSCVKQRDVLVVTYTELRHFERGTGALVGYVQLCAKDDFVVYGGYVLYHFAEIKGPIHHQVATHVQVAGHTLRPSDKQCFGTRITTNSYVAT